MTLMSARLDNIEDAMTKGGAKDGKKKETV